MKRCAMKSCFPALIWFDMISLDREVGLIGDDRSLLVVAYNKRSDTLCYCFSLPTHCLSYFRRGGTLKFNLI